MSLSEIFIFADKHDCGYPKFLALMLLKAFTDNLSLSNIRARRAGHWITAGENVNAGLIKFLSLKQLV